MNDLQPVTDPMQLVALALEKGADPDRLEKLIALQERWERNRAAERFADAITAFQRECPQITERKPGGGGKYKYAPFEAIFAVIQPLLSRHGIALTFTTRWMDRGLEATCRVRVGTHAEETTVAVRAPGPITTKDGSSVVNDTQLDGQALSYAKRYAVCAALNIVCTGEDNDANPHIDFEEARELEAVLLQFPDEGVKERAGVLKLASAENLSQIPLRMFPDILRRLKIKLAQQQKEARP